MTLFNPSLKLPPRTQAAADRRDAIIALLQAQGFEITNKSAIDQTLNIIKSVSLQNPASNESALVEVRDSTARLPLVVQVTIATFARYSED
jgi:hypothetical protein